MKNHDMLPCQTFDCWDYLWAVFDFVDFQDCLVRNFELLFLELICLVADLLWEICECWFHNVKCYSDIAIHFCDLLCNELITTFGYEIVEDASEFWGIPYDWVQSLEIAIDFLLENIGNIFNSVRLKQQLTVPHGNCWMFLLEWQIHRACDSYDTGICASELFVT